MEPGELLRTHRAPDGLLERATLAADRGRAPRLSPMILAFAATFLFGISVGWTSSRAVVPKTPAPTRVASPALAAATDSVPVRLIFHADDARTVHVAGSWNNWDPEALPLLPSGDGTFSAIVALPRGRYEYLFVLDGDRWVLDPAAPLVVEDGFGQRNAVLEI